WRRGCPDYRVPQLRAVAQPALRSHRGFHRPESRVAPGRCQSGHGPFVVEVRSGTSPQVMRRTAMTQYLLSVHSVEGEVRAPMTDEEMQQSYKQVNALQDEMKDAGAWV